jgi:hypothetical protein
MNRPCATDYICHMHFPPNVHDSTHAWVPISHSSTCSMTSVWAHTLKQANTGFFYAQEHNQRYCLHNGKWYGSYQQGYRVRITTTDLRILRNIYILNSLSNNAASYNMLWKLPFKFPKTHYSWQSFHFISDCISSEVGIPSLPKWTKFNWPHTHMDWSWKDPKPALCSKNWTKLPQETKQKWQHIHVSGVQHRLNNISTFGRVEFDVRGKVIK